MTKRKRHSVEEETPTFGLADALAHIRSEAAKDKQNQNDDDGTWTLVGAHKKRRRDNHAARSYSLKEHEKEESILAEPQLPDSEPQEHTRRDRERRSTPPPNPFSTDTHGRSDLNSAPINPFSTEKSSDNKQHGRQERNGDDHERSPRQSSGRSKQDKAERKHEKRIEKSYPSIAHSNSARLQNHVKITDLQALALYLLADGNAPQWVAVKQRADIRQVVILLVPGLELGMFNGKLPLESSQKDSFQIVDEAQSTSEAAAAANADGVEHQPKRLRISPDDFYPASLKAERLPAALRPLADIFPHVWPIMAIGEHRGQRQYYRIHSPIHTMLTSQIPKTQEQRQMKKSSHHKGPLPQNTKHWDNKRTPITEFIASHSDQQENDYVVHPAWYSTPEALEAANLRRANNNQGDEDGWVDTDVQRLEDGDVPDSEIEKGSVTAGRTILTVDCEMCKAENDELVLTRVSIINWDGDVVLDKLVKPDVPIKDYLTQYSGITEAMLKDVTTRLPDIQKELQGLLTPKTIFMGHSLNSDLNALKMTHPFLVDTGILYPHPRGPPYKQSLKWLSQRYISKEIQKGHHGHDSIEDARACLALVKQKCERGPAWGTSETNAESIFKRLGRTIRPKSSNTPRSGAVVDWGDPMRGHGGQAQVAVGCKSDNEVVEGIEVALKGQAVHKEGATGKVDLIWGRLRELELLRGWWDETKTADVEEIRQTALKKMGKMTSKVEDEPDVSGHELGVAVGRTVEYITRVYESLPPCTAFIVYSGTGDPREMRRLQTMRQTYQREYQTKNWDNLSVKWTDTEVQALSKACQSAREGVGFVTVK